MHLLKKSVTEDFNERLFHGAADVYVLLWCVTINYFEKKT